MFRFSSYSFSSNRNLTVSYASENISVQQWGSDTEKLVLPVSDECYTSGTMQAYLVCMLLPSVLFTDVKFLLLLVF